MTGFSLKDIGGLRLTLLGLAVLSLPMVLFADMEPEGIGILTAYIIPAVVVLFFFVLMLDALMNRVFMIEQPPQEQAPRRLRMWLDLAAAGGPGVVFAARRRERRAAVFRSGYRRRPRQ